jgi:oxalate---CoA ligase
MASVEAYSDRLELVSAKCLVVCDGANQIAVDAARALQLNVFSTTDVLNSSKPLASSSSLSSSLSSLPDDEMMILLTSGTTDALPKMVPLTHAQVLTRRSSGATVIPVRDDDVFLSMMPLTGYAPLCKLVRALCAGACVVRAPRFLDGFSFLQWIERWRVTYFGGVPSVHELVCAAAEMCEARGDTLPSSVRFFFSAGTAMSSDVGRALRRLLRCQTVAVYGSSECGMMMSRVATSERPVFAVPAGVDDWPELALLHADATWTRLGADAGRRGLSGELMARGPTVTRGYARNDAANAQALLDVADGGAPFFRTGDLARASLDADSGSLRVELVGRSKEMINRGGKNVSPFELEQCLLAHDGVEKAVAFPLRHARLGEAIGVAIVRNRESGGVGDVDNGAFLRDIDRVARETLAPSHRPDRVFVVDAIPVDARSGKVARLRLADALGVQSGAADGGQSDGDKEGGDGKGETATSTWYASMLGADQLASLMSSGWDSMRFLGTAIKAKQALSARLNASMWLWLLAVCMEHSARNVRDSGLIDADSHKLIFGGAVVFNLLVLPNQALTLCKGWADSVNPVARTWRQFAAGTIDMLAQLALYYVALFPLINRYAYPCNEGIFYWSYFSLLFYRLVHFALPPRVEAHWLWRGALLLLSLSAYLYTHALPIDVLRAHLVTARYTGAQISAVKIAHAVAAHWIFYEIAYARHFVDLGALAAPSLSWRRRIVAALTALAGCAAFVYARQALFPFVRYSARSGPTFYRYSHRYAAQSAFAAAEWLSTALPAQWGDAITECLLRRDSWCLRAISVGALPLFSLVRIAFLVPFTWAVLNLSPTSDWFSRHFSFSIANALHLALYIPMMSLVGVGMEAVKSVATYLAVDPSTRDFAVLLSIPPIIVIEFLLIGHLPFLLCAPIRLVVNRIKPNK